MAVHVNCRVKGFVGLNPIYNLKYKDFVLFTASDVVVDWALQDSIVSIVQVIVSARASVKVLFLKLT